MSTVYKVTWEEQAKNRCSVCCDHPWEGRESDVLLDLAKAERLESELYTDNDMREVRRVEIIKAEISSWTPYNSWEK